jgi:hypothetical protein
MQKPQEIPGVFENSCFRRPLLCPVELRAQAFLSIRLKAISELCKFFPYNRFYNLYNKHSDPNVVTVRAVATVAHASRRSHSVRISFYPARRLPQDWQAVS